MPILLLTAWTIGSQPKNASFEHISMEDGLSQASVNSIYQDSRGYMWFGTQYGLNKYNGHEFETFHHNPSELTSINSNFVSSIYEDSKGRMWIGTRRGLNLLDRNLTLFSRYDVFASGPTSNINDMIVSILEDEEGHLWLSTPSTLYDFNPETSEIQRYLPKGLSGNHLGSISRLYLDSKKNLWVCTEAVVRLFNRKSKRFENPLGDANETIENVLFFSMMIEDRSGNFWIGVRGAGMKKFDVKTGTFKIFQQIPGDKFSLSSNFINDIVEDKYGNLWISTGREGLNYFDTKTENFTRIVKDPLQEGNLISNALNVMYYDNSDGLWVGTWHNGLNYYKEGNQFVHYKKDASSNSLSANFVSSIAEGENGNLWVGIDDGGGLNYVDRSRNSVHHIRIPSIDENLGFGWQSIKAMIMDRSNQLWIGTMNGLYRYRPFSDEWTHFAHDPKDDSSIGFGFITALMQDFQGNIWIGTRGGGLCKYVDKFENFIRYPYSPESENDYELVRVLYEDKSGIIWVGTMAEGLLSFNPITEEFIFHEELVDENNNSKLAINAIIEDNYNNLWIGTFGSGIKVLDSKGSLVRSFTKEDGLASDLVMSMVEDPTNRLWIATSKGLSRYNQEENIFTNFSQKDGLQVDEFRFHSFCKTSQGELCFGGTNGFNLFDPLEIIKDKSPLPIELSGLYIFNDEATPTTENSPLAQDISNTSSLILNHKQSVFRLEFTALNYSQPHNQQFAYRLFPHEEEWNRVGNLRFANYSNIPPGEYTFQVVASHSDQIADRPIKSLNIKILPKPWLTWWAKTFYFLLILAVLYLIHYFEVVRLKNKNELKMERVSHQKDEEIFQTKINFFTNISHEFRTPLTLIMSPIEMLQSSGEGSEFVKKQYDLIARNSKQLLRLINQLLDMRKIEIGGMKLQATKGDIVSFIQDMVSVFIPTASLKNIDLIFHSDVLYQEVWFDWDKMEKIVNNLLSNAIKFTPKDGRIQVKFFKSVDSSRTVHIEISDNGCGIAEDKILSIFERFYQVDDIHNAFGKGSGIGLTFAKELTELHGGELLLESVEGLGSTFTVCLPLGKEHIQEESIVEFTTKGKVVSKSTSYSPKTQEISSTEGQKHLGVILVVDDSPDIRSLVRSYLEAEYQIIEASNGKEALSILSNVMPDLVISDVMMPEMDGIDLCKSLKSNLQSSHIPVILLSALTSVQARIKGIENGADAYVPKPFNLELLKTRVVGLLEMRKKLKEVFESNILVETRIFSPSERDANFIDEVVQIIDQNLDNSNFDKEDLLKQMKMSHSTLYRKLKSLTDLSSTEFIRSIRLKRAEALLKLDDLNVSQIAYRVGFTDPKYFSTSFKKEFGYSPSRYRARQRSKNILGKQEERQVNKQLMKELKDISDRFTT